DSPHDPNIRLLTVTPDDAEFWEGPGRIAGTIKLAAAAATHSRPDYGTDRKVTM
ncbi:MAG: pyridoxamine 5'-phosphate oxidase family protein, partial [Alphaproteobacteria bacterium]|nr:pyridoxamine 5'-phosphate oxidase family protein [Alphaproteobacteria bacterium]